MAEVPTRRSLSGLAIERRLEALSIPAMGLAGGNIVLILLTEKWVRHGPFPRDLETCSQELYDTGSFGLLKLVVSHFCVALGRSWTTNADDIAADDLYALFRTSPKTWCRKTCPKACFWNRDVHSQLSVGATSNPLSG